VNITVAAAAAAPVAETMKTAIAIMCKVCQSCSAELIGRIHQQQQCNQISIITVVNNRKDYGGDADGYNSIIGIGSSSIGVCVLK